jgi:hypothetical protein
MEPFQPFPIFFNDLGVFCISRGPPFEIGPAENGGYPSTGSGTAAPPTHDKFTSMTRFKKVYRFSVVFCFSPGTNLDDIRSLKVHFYINNF